VVTSGGFEKGTKPELSKGLEGSLLRSRFFTTGFTGFPSGQLSFDGAVNFKAFVTGGGGSIFSGKGIDVLWLLQDIARIKNADKKI
jgi:hypothetical protein